MPRCPTFAMLILTAVLLGTFSFPTSGMVGDGAYQVAQVVGQVTVQHLAGCHLVLAATTQHSSLLQHITRSMSAYAIGGVVVESSVPIFWGQHLSQKRLLQELWGDARFTCRALILHLTSDDLAFRFLDASELWRWPETRLVVLGGRSGLETFLYHPSLRNAIHVLYLALSTRRRPQLGNTKLNTATSQTVWNEDIDVYRRCLYCNSGELGVLFLRRWRRDSDMTLPDDLFKDEPMNFMMHKFDIRAVHDFPVSGFKQDSQTPGTSLTPIDSLDVRMLKVFAAHSNFTYEVREPLDRQFGVAIGNGNWTGTVGALQHQQADFSMLLTPTPARVEVVQFSSLYNQDTVIIISLKPKFLPQHLALIRPFPGVMWVGLAIGLLVWAMALWLLQKAWFRLLGGRETSLSNVLLSSWGALLQRWIPDPPNNLTSRVLVGLWLVSCLIITTAYRSSLVAHLIVQDKEAEINTFQDLVSRDGWQWGTGRIGDVFTIYFDKHPDPIVQRIFKEMQYAPEEEQFRRVLGGGYSYITFKYPALPIVAASYSNKQGYTPIHTSRTEYPPFAGDGWGFRIGAPYRERISRMMQRLKEGGFVNYWLSDVISNHVRNKWKATEDKGNEEEGKENIEAEEGQRVLGLNHLQGAFYLLLIGQGVAFLTLLGESIGH